MISQAAGFGLPYHHLCFEEKAWLFTDVEEEKETMGIVLKLRENIYLEIVLAVKQNKNRVCFYSG